MKYASCIALLLSSSLALSYANPTHTGYGTAYSGAYDMNATGQNMCQFSASQLNARWQVFYGAMNQADWNALGGTGSVCGRCITVRGVPGQTTPGFQIKDIIVKIVDQCPSWACDKGNVDFSTVALKQITGFSWDKKQIEWSWLDACPDNPTAIAAAAASNAANAAAAAADAAQANQNAVQNANDLQNTADQLASNSTNLAAIQAAAKNAAVAASEVKATQAAKDRALNAAKTAKAKAQSAKNRAKHHKSSGHHSSHGRKMV